MQEFDVALHHNVLVKRKKRLIVLMLLQNPTKFFDDAVSETAALRQYMRQYTYVDCAEDDWLEQLNYALPLHGMNQSD